MTTPKITDLKETLEFYKKITSLLKKLLPQQVNLIDKIPKKCTITSISSIVSPIWLKVDPSKDALIVGRGVYNKHFSISKQETALGFDMFIEHLTIRQRRIDYFIGNYIYRSDYEMYTKGKGYVTYGSVKFDSYHNDADESKKTVNFDPILNKREYKKLLDGLYSTT